MFLRLCFYVCVRPTTLMHSCLCTCDLAQNVQGGDYWWWQCYNSSTYQHPASLPCCPRHICCLCAWGQTKKSVSPEPCFYFPVQEGIYVPSIISLDYIHCVCGLQCQHQCENSSWWACDSKACERRPPTSVCYRTKKRETRTWEIRWFRKNLQPSN